MEDNAITPVETIPASVDVRRTKAGRILSPLPHNPAGARPFRKVTLKQVRKELCPGVTRLDCVADTLVTKAEQGERWAMELLHDVLDGPIESQSGNLALGVNVTVAHCETTEE